MFVVVVFFTITQSAWSQTKSIVIDDNKISIEQAFRKIEKQTGYSFWYDRASLDVSKRIELPRTKLSINEVLDIILLDSGCSYKFDKKSILIVKNNSVEASGHIQKNSSSELNAHIVTRTIKGIVTDEESGRPLMGAKVSVSGVLNSSAETDHAGQFTIKNVPEGIQRIRTYLDGYYLSERGVQVAASQEDIRIPLKTTSVNLGSIRSDADKGGIVTVETSPEVEETLTHTLSALKDSVATKIEIVQTSESKIISPYLNGVNYGKTKFGIKTNLLYLATGTPNIGIEWVIGKKWTAEITGGFNMFKYGDVFKEGGNTVFNHWLVKPEVKYWLCRTFDGHFFGVHGLVGRFNVSELPMDWLKSFPKNTAYVGWAYGGGITYGYQWAIAKRLNLEASIGVGYVRFEHDVYDLFDDCKACRYTKTRDYFGPTKAGLSLIYTF